jgi:hypothetical protein
MFRQQALNLFSTFWTQEAYRSWWLPPFVLRLSSSRLRGGRPAMLFLGSGNWEQIGNNIAHAKPIRMRCRPDAEYRQLVFMETFAA